MKKSIKILALVLTLVLLSGALAVFAFAADDAADEISGVRFLFDEKFEIESQTWENGASLPNSDSNNPYLSGSGSTLPLTWVIYAGRNGTPSITTSEYEPTNHFFNWNSNSSAQGTNGGAPYLVLKYGNDLTASNYMSQTANLGKDVTSLVYDVDLRVPTGTIQQYMTIAPTLVMLDGTVDDNGTPAPKRVFAPGTKPQFVFRNDGGKVVFYSKDSTGAWTKTLAKFDSSSWIHLTMAIVPEVKLDSAGDNYLELYTYFYVNGEYVYGGLAWSNEGDKAENYYQGDKTAIYTTDTRVEFPNIYDTTGNTQVNLDNISAYITTPEYTGNLFTVIDTQASILDADVNVYDPDNTPFGNIVCTNSTTGVNYDSLQKAINKADEGDVITLAANVADTVTVDKLVTIACGDYTVTKVNSVGDITVKFDEETKSYVTEYAQEGIFVEWNACPCGLDSCDETHPGSTTSTVYEGQSIIDSYDKNAEWSLVTTNPAAKYILTGWEDENGNIFDVNATVTADMVAKTEGYLALTPVLAVYTPVISYTNASGELVDSYSDVSLNSVFVNAQNNSTIDLLADIKVSAAIGSNKNFTLALNGHTIDAVNDSTTSAAKFHLFNVNAGHLTIDGTVEGSKIFLTYYNGSKFAGDSVFYTNKGTSLTVEGSGLSVYSCLLAYIYGGDVVFNGGSYFNTNAADHWGYIQAEGVESFEMNDATVRTESMGTLLCVRGTGMGSISATVDPVMDFNNCVLIAGTTGNVVGYGQDRVAVNFNDCYIGGNVNPIYYATNGVATNVGTITIGEGCFVKESATVSTDIKLAEGCALVSAPKIVTYKLPLNTFAAENGVVAASTYEITVTDVPVTYGSVVADPNAKATINWYNTDGSLMGTTEGVPGTEATAPAMAVDGTEGWVKGIYTDWTNEDGEVSTLVPVGADEVSFTLVENSAVTYVAGDIPLYMNYELIMHFQLNIYAPVNAPEGITDYLVNGRTVSGNYKIGGVQCGVQNFWPNAQGLDDNRTQTVTFTYNGTAISKSYVVNVADYAEQILNGEYSAETKTAIADMLRYVAAANKAAGQTVAAKVNTLLETAPVSEIPELEAAVNADLTEISKYIDKISVVFNSSNGCVQFRFDKTQYALDVEAEDTSKEENLTFVVKGGSNTDITATDAAIGRYPQIAAGTEAYGNAFKYTHNMRVYDFDETFTIQVRLDGEVIAEAEYSVYDYLEAIKDVATEDQWNLLLVTLAFSKSASVYTGK